MEIIEYKGHLITLDVADRGKGWTWTYQIGSGPVIANIGRPHPSETLARLEAVAVAEREVDDDARYDTSLRQRRTARPPRTGERGVHGMTQDRH
jgi:hypothetical protein